MERRKNYLLWCFHGGPAPPWRPPVSLQTGERRPRRLSRGILGRYTPCGKGLKILLLPPAKELGKPAKRRQRSRKRADFETAARLAAQKGRESQCRNGVAPTISTSPLPFVRVGERVEHARRISTLHAPHLHSGEAREASPSPFLRWSPERQADCRTRSSYL